MNSQNRPLPRNGASDTQCAGIWSTFRGMEAATLNWNVDIAADQEFLFASLVDPANPVNVSCSSAFTRILDSRFTISDLAGYQRGLKHHRCVAAAIVVRDPDSTRPVIDDQLAVTRNTVMAAIKSISSVEGECKSNEEERT